MTTTPSRRRVLGKDGDGGVIMRKNRGLRGVRLRQWGRWAAEIRMPCSRTRLWLGTYDSADQAARAYDAALYCLYGTARRFNFPEATLPDIPEGWRRRLKMGNIKAIAEKHALSPPPDQVLPAEPATLPPVPVLSTSQAEHADAVVENNMMMMMSSASGSSSNLLSPAASTNNNNTVDDLLSDSFLSVDIAEIQMLVALLDD